MNYLEQASTYAADIDSLILWIGVIAGFFFLLAEAVLFYFMFKFRRKDGQKAQYITGEKHEEMKWIHWPHHIILLFDVVILVLAINVWYKVKQDLPDEDGRETVEITGYQWAWTFKHPGVDKKLGTDDDVTVVDELHVKVDTLYHFKLGSADVLHDFSVPVFRLKHDAIPGRIVTGWFKPTMTGEFDIQCAEMCGIGHGIMKARLFIETEDEHNKWLAQRGGAHH